MRDKDASMEQVPGRRKCRPMLGALIKDLVTTYPSALQMILDAVVRKEHHK